MFKSIKYCSKLLKYLWVQKNFPPHLSIIQFFTSLPIELLIEEEDQQINIDLSLVKHMHDRHPVILQLQQVLEHQLNLIHRHSHELRIDIKNPSIFRGADLKQDILKLAGGQAFDLQYHPLLMQPGRGVLDMLDLLDLGLAAQLGLAARLPLGAKVLQAGLHVLVVVVDLLLVEGALGGEGLEGGLEAHELVLALLPVHALVAHVLHHRVAGTLQLMQVALDLEGRQDIMSGSGRLGM